MRTLTALTALLLCAGAFGEEPADEDAPRTEPPCAFGYCMGQAINEEPEGRNVDGLRYITENHTLFDAVAVYWSPPTGVCRLRGLYEVSTPDFAASRKTTEEAFDMLTVLVEKRYGERSYSNDYRWEEYTDSLSYTWWGENLPGGISSIEVEARHPHVAVDYKFENYSDCLEESKASLVEDF